MGGNEVTRAGLAEVANATAITTEAARALAAEAVNGSAISDEASRAGSFWRRSDGIERDGGMTTSRAKR